MKVFISADIEGVNNIATWDETSMNSPEYQYFRKQMTEEVKRACIGAKNAGATEIFIKDAHDSARNLILSELPEYVKLHRGWQGCPCSMMAGLDETFDAIKRNKERIKIITRIAIPAFLSWSLFFIDIPPKIIKIVSSK